MSKGRGPWQAGRRAWERLNGWHQDAPLAKPGHPDGGPEALAALADIGLLRHLLDQAELVAVRTHEAPQIVGRDPTQLGVTRRSAWERWRDLDDEQPPSRAVASTTSVVWASSDQQAGMGSDMFNEDVIGRTARELRRNLPCACPGGSHGMGRRGSHPGAPRLVGVRPDPEDRPSRRSPAAAVSLSIRLRG